MSRPCTYCLLKSSLLALTLLLPFSFLACGQDTAQIGELSSGRADTMVTLDNASVIITIFGTLAGAGEPGDGIQAPYPGAASLLNQLRIAQQEGDGIFFIPGPEQDLSQLKTWLEDNKFPEGALPEGTKAEAMLKILEEQPERRFVIIADDPVLLQQLMAGGPDQIIGALLMASLQEPAADPAASLEDAPSDQSPLPTPLKVDNYAQAAAQLFALKVMGEDATRLVMTEAREQGLELSDEEINRLIEAHRPAAAPAAIQELIRMATPKYKSSGKPTEVVFNHLIHAGDYGGGCDSCHSTIADELDAESNTKALVHGSCKSCHSSGKPAKSFKCKSCHTPVAE